MFIGRTLDPHTDASNVGEVSSGGLPRHFFPSGVSETEALAGLKNMISRLDVEAKLLNVECDDGYYEEQERQRVKTRRTTTLTRT